MRILLIGATGQIGYALANQLAKTEHVLSVMVRKSTKLKFAENVSVLKFDKFDEQSFKQALENIEYVIYGVGLPEQFLFDTSLFEKVNYNLLKIFLQVLEQTDVVGLTYISTYEVFKARNNEIVESESLTEREGLTPYFSAMAKAYELIRELDSSSEMNITTIHPAAVYGGLNTGNGFTAYIENLLHRRFWRVPFIFSGRFPLVHVDALADAIVKTFNFPGSYLVSDQMTSLKEIAGVVRKYKKSLVPLVAPIWVVRFGAFVLEIIARLTRTNPIIARVQIDFITKGFEPKSTKIQNVLKWKPMPLEKGIERYLRI